MSCEYYPCHDLKICHVPGVIVHFIFIALS